MARGLVGLRQAGVDSIARTEAEGADRWADLLNRRSDHLVTRCSS
ncbi:hypothetical protein ACGFNX_06345 [Streptomyces sp. NPDC048723]